MGQNFPRRPSLTLILSPARDPCSGPVDSIARGPAGPSSPYRDPTQVRESDPTESAQPRGGSLG
jgi:hypothetical protein